MKTLRHVAGIVLGILREIADQNAYARHLKHCGAVHSPSEWKRFTEHRFKMKYSQGRCC
jgi:hypothetical protein